MTQLGRRKWAFKPSMVADAPDTPGLYALWDGERLLCVGRAEGGHDTLRGRLAQHLASAAQGRLAATHYSWEICRNPAEREAEVRAALGREDAAETVE
jgi:hypothetical protein